MTGVKRIGGLLIILIMITSGINVSIGYAKEGMIYNLKKFDEVDNRWEIHIDYPEFTSLQDKLFQKKLNKLIQESVDEDIQIAKKEAADNDGFPIQFYEEAKLIQDNNFYSVIMTGSLSRGNTFSGTVRSFNFYDQKNAELVMLMDIMNLDKIDEAVKKQLREKPDMYFAEEFQQVRPDTAFYLQDGQLVLIFDKYEIAPGVYGNPEIKIPLNHRY